MRKYFLLLCLTMSMVLCACDAAEEGKLWTQSRSMRTQRRCARWRNFWENLTQGAENMPEFCGNCRGIGECADCGGTGCR